jgi:hypothetical protein
MSSKIQIRKTKYREDNGKIRKNIYKAQVKGASNQDGGHGQGGLFLVVLIAAQWWPWC